jgi:hypothetical protein
MRILRFVTATCKSGDNMIETSVMMVKPKP